MKTAFGILKRDLLALLKNPIALLVVGALLVLPGLYAWYCIVANWDPYSNTGGMPIAVVNEDRGAESDLTGEVNIGEMVTEKLEGNDQLDWRIYDDKERALEDTRTAEVYATIVLPENLSENVLGIFEGSDEEPTIYYYPNEKYNAVATKVTDSAAQTLVRQINQGFSSTVNQKILESTQKIVDEVEQKADQSNGSAIAQVRQIQADLDQAIVSLDDVTSSIEGWRTAASGANSALAATAEQLPAIRTMLTDGSKQLNSFRKKTGKFEGELSASVLESASTISKMSADTTATLAQATDDLQAVKTSLEALLKVGGDDKDLRDAIEGLKSIDELIEGIIKGVDKRVTEVNANVQEITGKVKTGTTTISDEVMPQLNTGAYELATSMSLLSGAVGQFEPQVVALRGVLSETDSALVDAVDAIAEAKSLLNTISGNLRGTVNDIGAIGSALEIEKVKDLIDVDPANLGTFITMPVHMTTEKIFPVSNYGTAVAPFYTNLALWIGCFILASLLKLEVDRKGFEKATSTQRYFGRWLLFVLLATLQSQVICGVDILLGIDCVNPGYFMMAGFVCSFVYVNIIFALVITFRNIGKTLCILLLIMQVPGSSGMYPIEMMPQFFQFIHPVLPFTYGIDAMREALSGMYGNRFLFDLSYLLLLVPLALLLGLVIRPAASNLTLLFDREMSATGFFASEVHAQVESDRLRGIMRLFSSSDAMRDSFEERAWRFNRHYPRLRRVGSIAIMAIPFALLLIVLPFNLSGAVDIDVKLTALIVMVIVLLIVQFAMIILEYVHREISEETRLIGLSILNESGLADNPEDNLALIEMMLSDDGEAGASGGLERKGKHAREKSPEAESALRSLSTRASRRGGHRRGSPTWDIFSTDMRLGFQSVIGIVVIMLLVITPSMYAWFNIAGSWDPYSSTGNLKVAVANEDDGYKGELVPVTINVGDSIVSQLRGNTSFDWEFVTKDEAIAGVEDSSYYAAIEIPSDFSANMMTYLTDDASYPEVIYYTNEKENPIAPIITQKGADAIQENIRVSFTERIDEVVLSVAYDVLNYVTNPNMSSYVVKMSKHLDDATADAKDAARELRSLAGLTRTISSVVDATGSMIDGMKAAGESVESAVGDAKAGVGSASAALDQAVEVARDLMDGNKLDVKKIQKIVDAALELLEGGADIVPGGIQDAIDDVTKLRDKMTSDEQKAKCDAVLKSLKEAKGHADDVPGEIASARKKTDNLITTTTEDVAKAKAYFDDTVAPSMAELRTTLGGLSSSAGTVVDGLKNALGGIDDSTGGLSSQLTTLSGGLTKAGDKLESSAAKIEETKQRVADALKSGNLKQIEDVILGGDPEVLATSLATPLHTQREPVYSVANYGSAMAPFYTVLSLWVGALVMISTMRAHVAEERIEELRERYGRVRPRHEFFGRYGIFGFVGLLQSSLVLLGDLLLLHIECANPVLFFLFGVLVGQLFCLIVYTITELFGDVGKALCVILLIMQVAASGGTFPAEMLDPILFNVVPFLPFYYGMSLLQECVAGILWPTAVVCIVALVAMAAGMLVIGLPLRRPFRKLNDFFEEQLEKTGYM